LYTAENKIEQNDMLFYNAFWAALLSFLGCFTLWLGAFKKSSTIFFQIWRKQIKGLLWIWLITFFVIYQSRAIILLLLL